jgi:hypothetical protein
MPIVASRTLLATDALHGQFSVRIEIGQPYRCAKDDWACAVGLEGLHEHLWDQRGIDSFQALIQAQALAKTLLRDFVRDGGRLAAADGTKVDVDTLFTVG